MESTEISRTEVAVVIMPENFPERTVVVALTACRSPALKILAMFLPPTPGHDRE